MKPRRLLSELFFPSDLRCIICDAELPEKTRYGVCRRCELDRNTRYCARCGRAIANMAEYCDNCMDHAVAFDLARAPFVYENEIVKLVHRLKFGSAKYLAPFMAQFMADTWYECGLTADFITFVPLHPKRLKKRGYNQAREIAAALAEILGLPLVSALTRVKETAALAKLGRKERAEAISGAFEVDPAAAVKGRRIIVVDDVFTSGATAGECCTALKKAKAAKTYVLTFATARSKPFLY